MNRIALVTGGNRGIGLEVIRQLVQQGHNILLGARDLNGIEDALSEIPQNERHLITPVRVDLKDAESIRQLAAKLSDKDHAVDILINNGAVYPDGQTPGLSISPEIFEETFAINVVGALRLSQLLAPGMVRRKWGRIVNVSSGYGQMHAMSGGVLSYRVSKAALNMMTIVLAEELRGKGVLVNAVDPGWTKTRMGGSGASRTAGQAAEGIVWAATLDDNGPTGGFFFDKRKIDW